jgi:hypothetical protein
MMLRVIPALFLLPCWVWLRFSMRLIHLAFTEPKVVAKVQFCILGVMSFVFSMATMIWLILETLEKVR